MRSPLWPLRRDIFKMYSSALIKKWYPFFHAFLVRHTHAYQTLFSEIASEIKTTDYPRHLPALIVPSSTGEILSVIKDSCHPWWGVDSNLECLKKCSEQTDNFRPIPTDLNQGWPFEKNIFGLSLSIHALHFLSNPALLLKGIYESLAPGGLAIFVTFRGEGNVGEELVKSLLRIRLEKGLFETLNILPWKVFDSLMLNMSTEQHHFWTKESFRQLLVENRFIIRSISHVFNGYSILASCHKETIK